MLTLLTQMGGIIWLIAGRFRANHLWIFLALYTLMIGVNHQLAPLLGREALPCFGDKLKSRSVIFCALNRNYVDANLMRLLEDFSTDIEAAFPATITNTLDGSFPFLNMPMVPHPSHRNGKQIDLAFYYQYNGYDKDDTPSPFGYLAFDLPEDYPQSETCPQDEKGWRWDFAFLQGAWEARSLDVERMKYTLEWMRDHQFEYAIEMVLVEPRLIEETGVYDEIFRFQGCYAPRQDDHLHIAVF